MKFNQRRQFVQVALFSLMALGAGTAFAQAAGEKPTDPRGGSIGTKPDQTRPNEKTQITGVIKSVSKERGLMVVRGSNGTEYSLPITQGLGDVADLVGKKITIEVTVKFKPLEVGVKVTF